jgi:hypothetical protein
VTEAARAIKRSIRLVKHRITSFASTYGHLIRIVNQIWGRYASKEWKSWWATLGMLQFRKHCDGADHSDCNRFIFYSRCGCARPRSADDDEASKSWHVNYTQSPAQPRGISELAQLIMTMYTLEPKFQRRVMQTIQFGRTNNLESFFHLVDINMPMYSNAPERLDAHNLKMSKLMWNESKHYRAVAHGQIRKSEKKGVHMYYAKSARRQPVQLWQNEATRRSLTSADGSVLPVVERRVTAREQVVEQRYANRKERRDTIDAKTWSKIAGMSGTVRLAAEVLFHATAEGTLQPERSDDGETMYFSMPDYIAQQQVKVPAPFPLKRGVTEVPIDLTAADAQLAELADECRDEDAGSDVEDQDEETADCSKGLVAHSEDDGASDNDRTSAEDDGDDY